MAGHPAAREGAGYRRIRVFAASRHKGGRPSEAKNHPGDLSMPRGGRSALVVTRPVGAAKRKCEVEHRHTDAELVERARRGDQQAWAGLYRVAYPRLVGFAHRRLGAHDLACDTVSETMARAVAAIDAYVGDDAGFTPWLFGICRHVIADMQRAMFRALPPGLLRHDAEPASPEDAVVEDEQRTALRAAFGRLDADERELLELRVVAGLSSAEVAAMLGKQPSAVRMAQKRALVRLRTFVEEMSRVG
jgi:RNA polymerase sigma-70 factor (ECF subfamily)